MKPEYCRCDNSEYEEHYHSFAFTENDVSRGLEVHDDGTVIYHRRNKNYPLQITEFEITDLIEFLDSKLS